MNFLRYGISGSVMVVSRMWTGLIGLFSSLGIIFSEISSLPGLKRDLAVSQERLAYQEFLLQEKDHELSLLKTSLRLRESSKLDMVPALVVGFVEGPFGGTVFVNRGHNDGVEVNDPIFSGGGIFIGRVVEKGPNNSKVLLTTSPRSRIHVRFERSRLTGVLEGGIGGALIVREIDKEAVLEVGEFILTTGQDGLALPGFLVGRIKAKRLQPNQLFQEAEVEHVIKSSSLEEVYVGIL